jgi:4-hydroxy-2-oxoheptanedioate aldolase
MDTFAMRLRRRETVVGTVLTLPSVPLAELAAEAVDFVWVDLEHGALGMADVQPLAVAARAAGCAALARLAHSDSHALGALLDAGVDGVVAPGVESAEQARRLVERLRYPPRGSRGFAARRAHSYGRPGIAVGSSDPVCIAQIESPAGVAGAAEIAAVDGVDALVVGSADLSLALGAAHRLESGVLGDALARVRASAAGAGIPWGIAGPDDALLIQQLGGGDSTIVVYSADVRVYARAWDEAIAALEAPRVRA